VIWGNLQIPLVLASIFFGYFLLGWAGLFWMGAIRLVYCLHMQAFVNSLLHLKPGLAEGVDSSQNIWWLGPLHRTAWGVNGQGKLRHSTARPHYTQVPIDRPSLPSGIRSETAIRGTGLYVSTMATEVQDSVVSGVRQDRRCIRESDSQLRGKGRHSCSAIQERREQGGKGTALH